ncbi:hypothetical protein ACQ1Q1_11385 [Ornithobacterium rhinotracheale]|uniref:DUF3450 domain-containing protein n=1 Tax=Ornithobacterium rhinotracheale (strain ATCC 51463 / DSM 15997 / CCUG 23171 / CIP 104009 / LMG 9086) TaxID=867902 RepID=I3ZXX2_ORNRL|nr:hypothetical protein [Ornithobacterium rhinotracheale]AFL96556.1 hypothetical protein Ornrh_0339 [Ornithobacterium rhinotracheale DSM 15997]MCK0194880.1 hypothetical protein [Ornithobacterium rhinotracheale]MCK0202943.1 hypothetical protein [Ornithobacterium rhinotracheale]UOH62878.1 hypothetical protein MT993_07630 [Ornithobacterium rhinotracheale]UOH64915.1 hypothetical protein MT999_06780 [Ornithobacterium rhinotracheale]
MKKCLLGLVFLSTTLMAQESNQDLRKEVETIKVSLKNLHSEIQSVKSENSYLKKVLEINQPVLEQRGKDINYRVIKVIGDKKTKTIQINLLIEAIENGYRMYLNEISIFDLEGNEVKFDYNKTENQGELTIDVPKKVRLYFTYTDQELDTGLPKVLKLLRFKNSCYKFNESDSVEFKDLNVTWN